jgi:hypothetical protein
MPLFPPSIEEFYQSINGTEQREYQKMDREGRKCNALYTHMACLFKLVLVGK